MDNYEVISEKMNKNKIDREYDIPQDIKSIDFFLNNKIPNNTFILLTCRQQINNLDEETIE